MGIYYGSDVDLMKSAGQARNILDKDVLDIPYPLPGVSAGIVKKINDSFKHYIFINKVSNNGNVAEYYCTRCGNNAPDKKITWEISGGRTMTPEHIELTRSKHNEHAMCPVCKRVGDIKRVTRLRNYDKYSEWHGFIVFQQAGPEDVFIRLLSAKRDRSADLRAKTVYVEWNFYHLTPGKCEYWYYGYGGWQCLSNERVLKCNANGCKIFGIEDLRGSFLQYSVTKDFINRFSFDPVNSACFAALYPCTEMLYKVGFHGVISEWLDRRKKNAYCLNLTAERFDKLFRLPKPTVDYLMEQSRKYSRVREYISNVFAGIQLFGKDVQGCKLAIECCDVYSFWGAQKLLSEVYRSLYGSGPKEREKLWELIRYIRRKADKLFYSFENCLRFYRDYLNEGIYIGLDFSAEVVRFPKDLKVAHDSTVEIANGIRDAEKNKVMKELYDKYTAKYGFEELGYMIIAPRGTSEIVSEGQQMGHCVGGYAERHAQGTTTILFVRKVSSPAESYATIEVKGTDVIQVQGRGNRPTWEKEEDKGEAFKKFIADWKKYIKKAKPPAIAAV